MDLTAIIWMVLLILFLIVEAACAIHLVCIWFAVGSLAALAVYFLHLVIAVRFQKLFHDFIVFPL